MHKLANSKLKLKLKLKQAAHDSQLEDERKQREKRALEKGAQMNQTKDRILQAEEEQRKQREEELAMEKEIAAQMALLKAEQLRSIANKGS